MNGTIKFLFRIIIFQYSLFIGISQLKTIEFSSDIFLLKLTSIIKSLPYDYKNSFIYNQILDDFRFEVIFKIFLILYISFIFFAILINLKTFKVLSAFCFLLLNLVDSYGSTTEIKKIDYLNVEYYLKKKKLVLSFIIFLGMIINCVLPKFEIDLSGSGLNNEDIINVSMNKMYKKYKYQEDEEKKLKEKLGIN